MPPLINGIDVQALGLMADNVRGGGCATAGVKVTTEWKGRTRSESTVGSFTCGGEPVSRGFKIACDEPKQMLGEDSAPNPQELLLSALNACMMVGYVAQASLRGINLTDLRIETEGELDMRGFLGVDPDVPAGYRRINYIVHLDGDGTADQFQEMHQAVMASSPNFFNVAQPIQMCGRLA